MSYKYLNKHPRAYRWIMEKDGSFRGNEVERNNACNCIQKSNFTSRRIIVAVSQRTLPIMLLINEKKEKKEKNIATANRISS